MSNEVDVGYCFGIRRAASTFVAPQTAQQMVQTMLSTVMYEIMFRAMLPSFDERVTHQKTKKARLQPQLASGGVSTSPKEAATSPNRSTRHGQGVGVVGRLS